MIISPPTHIEQDSYIMLLATSKVARSDHNKVHTSEKTVNNLGNAKNGLPEQLVADNEPQFVAIN